VAECTMADGDEACSVKVRADGRVELQCGGSKYRSDLAYNRRTQAIVERLDRLAKEYPKVCEQQDLRLLGETLFGVLFGQPVWQVLEPDNQKVQEVPLEEESLGNPFLRIINAHKAKLPGRALRLRLVFEQGADKWANLPWEFLYAFDDKNPGFFVASEGTRLSLTRIIEPPVQHPEPPNLQHMLLILAQPKELHFQLTADDFKAMQKHICDLLSLPGDRLEPMYQPTWDKLAARLTDKKEPVPDIIHFIGHGRFENGESQIALHRSKIDMDAERGLNPQQLNQQEADWRKAEDLSGQLVGRAPWLFFLQTCSSGRPALGGASRSTAQQIAQAGVPFVVAMQYDITADDAQNFADTFYAALGVDASVDEAVMQGRAALGNVSPVYGHPRFATPIVYLRSESRFLLRPRSVASKPQVDTADLWPQHCPACPGLLSDKRKRCQCEKRIRLVYCAAGHANVAGEDTECVMHGCKAPLEELPAVADTAAPRRRELP
jgi:hypothetical protein